MPRAALRTPLVREVSIYPGVDLALQLDIKLVQQFFLVREVGEECARSNARAPGDLRRRRAEPDVGNLVHRRLRDCARFSGLLTRAIPMDESTVVRRLESRQ